MKSFKRFVLGTALALGMALSNVLPTEAATFVELPLVNNAVLTLDAQDASDLEDINQVYYAKIKDTLEIQNEYSMVDGDEITKVIEKNSSKDAIPSKEGLAQIANEANVDMVFAMQIDKFDVKKIPFRREDAVLLTVNGTVLAYNQITGKYYQNKIIENIEMEEIFIPRGNWKMEEFAKIVGREVRHALNIKKIKINKPRLSKLGN